MKDKEKAKQIAEKSQILSDFPHDYHSVEYGALEMAKWKDEQLKKVCSRCEKHMALHGEMCPWRLIEKTYCWEK